ncbi:tyrosine-type recombinase/integrase [Lysobacter fragariae]
MAELNKVGARNKLTARPSKEPYWHKLSVGCYLGFRPSVHGNGTGTWLARYHDADTGKKPGKSLGAFDNLPPSERFDAAKKDAEEWFRHLSHGGSTEEPTVKEACATYAGNDAELQRRFRQYIDSDPIGSIKLQKLREHHVKEWRARLEAMPARVSRTKEGPQITRPRSPATVNRDMVALRAALNAALRRGEVATALAWRVALEPARATGRRQLYLDKAQRRAMLAELPADAAAFCRALCLLPLRPGALAGLIVRDFEPRTGTLVVERDKAGNGRSLKLPDDHIALFKAQVKGKLPLAPIFPRADGKAWDKDSWKGPIKDAAKAAKLPTETTAYTLRHSTITDLVTEGLDLMTTAKLAGTSIVMIQEHYGHLRGDHAAKALAGLVL